MGHEGMHYSLVSREVITDSVETVMSAERLDGSILLAGCDKSIPGMLMAAARLDLSSVFLYNGSTMPGTARLSDGSEREVTLIDAFEAVGACRAGRMSEQDVDAIERAVCPGEGVRWHVHGEHDGILGRGDGDEPARICRTAGDPPQPHHVRPTLGEAVVGLLEKGITARDIITRESLLNAVAVVMALGGPPMLCCTSWRSRMRPGSI